MRLLLYCHSDILLPRSPCLQCPRITASLFDENQMDQVCRQLNKDFDTIEEEVGWGQADC